LGQSAEARDDRGNRSRGAQHGAGLELRDDWILWKQDLGEGLHEALRSRLGSSDRPDAIFCDSLFKCDEIIAVLAESNLRHPDDVLLCGFDYPAPGSETALHQKAIHGPLLVVRQDTETMGKAAAELAIRAGAIGPGESERLIRPLLTWEFDEGEEEGAPSLFAKQKRRAS